MTAYIYYSSAHWSAYLGRLNLPPDGDLPLPDDVAAARAMNGNFDSEVAALSHYDDGVACCGGDA